MNVEAVHLQVYCSLGFDMRQFSRTIEYALLSLSYSILVSTKFPKSDDFPSQGRYLFRVKGKSIIESCKCLLVTSELAECNAFVFPRISILIEDQSMVESR